MKKVIALLFGMMAFLASCDKEESNASAYEFTITSDEKVDEIRVVGILADNSRTVIGRGHPSGGGYKVSMDDPLPAYYFYRIDEASNFIHAPRYSNPGVMCYDNINSFHAYKNNQLVGTFKYRSHISYGEDKEIESESCWLRYIYVDGDVDVTGTKNTTWGAPFQTFDLHFKKGWNAYVCIEYLHRDHTGYTQTHFTSDIPKGMRWELSR